MPNKIFIILIIPILYFQYVYASVALEFDEFSEAPGVQKGIRNWVGFIEEDLHASEEWCIIISAYIDDSALISSLGRYVLYCGFYHMNEDNLISVPYYTENQFRTDTVNSDLDLHSTWILLKNFWKPVNGVNLVDGDHGCPPLI